MEAIKKIIFGIPKIQLGVQLLIIAVAAYFLGDIIPLNLKMFFFAISLTLNQILLFSLPIIVFSCVLACMVALEKQAFSFLLILIGGVFASNWLASMTSYFVGYNLISNTELITPTPMVQEQVLNPLWDIKLPTLISNEKVLILGFIIGIGLSFYPNAKVKTMVYRLRDGVMFFLKRLFVPTLPFFILGFILKLQHTGTLVPIMTSYAPIILVCVAMMIIYVNLLFFTLAGFNFHIWLDYIRNVMPSIVLALSTMSSLATMPLTLKGAEQNTKNPELTQVIIPATVNIHMIGNSLIFIITMLSIMKFFGKDLPNMYEFFMFSLSFCLAKFSVAAIPSGTILIMLPLLEKYMGFTTEMGGLITTLLIILDPFITVGNVVGNGAFAILLSRIFRKQ